MSRDKKDMLEFINLIIVVILCLTAMEIKSAWLGVAIGITVLNIFILDGEEEGHEERKTEKAYEEREEGNDQRRA